jgi:hypothetical protein
MKRWIPVLLLGAIVLAGCNDNDLGIEKRKANRPPETILASGPPDGTTGAVYKVQLYWSGSDPDGTIDHYDFILVDHPAIKDNIDGSGADSVIVRVPEPDDPRWVGTTATDSVFITLADTLRSELQPSDSTGTAEEIRGLPWERWHTFFIRAVDNEGTPDPTPDYRSFNSVNIAPSVWLTEPIRPGARFDGPSTIIFNWDGEDPVGDGDVIDPVAARWVIIDTQIDALKQAINFPDSLYVLPSRYRWSEWRRWDAQDQTGRRAILRNLVQAATVGDRVLGWYIFAVQAMDEAGAITPVFDMSSDRRNNAVTVRVSGAVGPLLTVREPFLGTSQFLGGGRPVQIDIAAGQPLNFCWEGDAERYGGEIVDYRYGWDISNPEEDSEWDQNWCSSCVCATTRTFTSGTHTLFIQVRDNAETITEARFILQVNQVTRSRDLLWVDDTQEIIPNSGQERAEDERWLTILSELAAENDFQFDTVLDVFDVIDNNSQVPPINKVFDYQAVVWSVRGAGKATALATLARFVDPFLEKNRNTAQSFNFLGIYLRNNGRLWVHGTRPAKLLWPDLTNQQAQVAVNVTNWDDDPVEQHPFIDSVGTLSLLYAMGVEMFDCGGGTGCGRPPRARDRPNHFCRTPSRAAPQGSAVQTFETESYAGAPHTHQVDIQTSDVDLAGGGSSVTYETSITLDHKHMLTLTPDDFRQLQQGSTITVTTDTAAEPEPHAHDVVLVDQLGLWGAPILVTGASWTPSTSIPGRPNVEIFNMPGAMASEQPRLIPRDGISVPLYNFTSGVLQDPDTNTFYPLTADKQPVALLAKGDPRELFYSRAFFGFEPEGLTFASHKELTRFIVVRHFRTGIGDAP